MKDYEFKKGIESIRKIKLGSEEKNSILKNILDIPIVSPYATKESVWLALFKNPRRISQLWASVAVIGAMSTFILYNAESSLPGDILYPVKISFSEPLRGLLSTTPANKAEWESTKAIRRLDEAANLALKGKLDAKTRTDIEALFNSNVDSFNDSISQTASSTLQSDLIRTQFEANVSARVQVFESLGKNLDETNATTSTTTISSIISTTTASSTATSTATTTATSTENSEASSTSVSTSTEATSSAAALEQSNESQSEIMKEDIKKQNRMELKKLQDAVSRKLKERGLVD